MGRGTWGTTVGTTACFGTTYTRYSASPPSAAFAIIQTTITVVSISTSGARAVLAYKVTAAVVSVRTSDIGATADCIAVPAIDGAHAVLWAAAAVTEARRRTVAAKR